MLNNEIKNWISSFKKTWVIDDLLFCHEMAEKISERTLPLPAEEAAFIHTQGVIHFEQKSRL
ncbi:hypothetical protein [Paenibacillus dokdonensis]|uniref:hypothetical protein n=1 Tax=Paenibacillus dokdonensis TaxID=2567944 RepID=UPI003D2B8BA0